MWAFFGVALVLVLGVIVLLLRRYAGPNVPVVVKLATSYAWLTSLSIVVIVPIDVYTTLTKQQTPVMGVLWDICYWSTQV
jgi:hypothetical protein